jgi:hypothetical protein
MAYNLPGMPGPMPGPQRKMAGPPPNLGLPMGMPGMPPGMGPMPGMPGMPDMGGPGMGPGGPAGMEGIPPEIMMLILQQLMGDNPEGPVGPEFGPPTPGMGLQPPFPGGGPMMGPPMGGGDDGLFGGPPAGFGEGDMAMDGEEDELLARPATRKATPKKKSKKGGRK